MIHSSAYKTFVTGTSISVDTMPDHASGDVIVGFYVADGGSGSWSAPSGYSTAISSSAGGGMASAIFYKEATSSSESAPSASYSTSDQLVHYLIVLRGVDTADIIEASASTLLESVWKAQAPSITPTNNNCLIVYFMGADASRGQHEDPGMMALPRPPIDASINCAVNWTFQSTGGVASPRPFFYNQSTAVDGMQVHAIAFNLTTGIRPPHCDFSNPPTTIINPLRTLSTSNEFGGGNVDISSDITSVDGVTFNNFAAQTFGGLSPDGFFLGFNFTSGSSAAALEVYGTGIDISNATTTTSFDLTDKTVVIHSTMQSNAYLGSIDILGNNGIIFGLRSPDGAGKAYRLWEISSINGSPSPAKLHACVVKADDNTRTIEDIGTFDVTDVDGFVLAAKKGGFVSLRPGWCSCQVLNTIILLGGSSTTPITMKTFVDALRASQVESVVNQLGSSDKQFFSKQSLQIGNGSDDVYFKDENSNMQFASPSLSENFSADYHVGATDNGLTIDTAASNTIDLSSQVWSGPTGWPFTFDAGCSASATYITSSTTIIGANPTLRDVFTSQGGISFLSCNEIIHNSADLSGGCVIDSCVDAQAITFNGSTEIALQALVDNVANCTLSNNAVAIRIEYTGTGDISLDFDNITWTGNTTDIHYNSTNASQLTAVMENGSNATTSAISGAATGVTISSPTADLTVTSNESSSLIQVFTTGTQTVLTSTTGTSLVYTHSSETVDIVVQKAGFLPQRRTGVVLSGNVTQAFTLETDFNYNASHGLVYTTDFSYNRTTEELTIVSSTASPNNIYSALIDAFIAQTTLRNTAFKFAANGTSLYFTDGAEAVNDTHIDLLTGAGGVRYLDATDTVTAEWCGIVTDGITAGLQAEYQQQDGSGTTDANATGDISQQVKIYGDATHGNFDYRSHMVWKAQGNGYREARIDVLAQYSISALEPLSYVLPMTTNAISGLTLGDPSATGITITKETTPQSYDAGTGAKDFSITVLDSGTNSGETILREFNYNFAQDATYEGQDPFNWPEMIIDNGSAYETLRGVVEGDGTPALHGVFITRDGTNPHPDFTRFQADDGTYTSIVVSPSVDFSNLISGSQVVVFNTGTTTEVFRTNSSSTTETTGTIASGTYDYTIMRAGYVPIRVTGVSVTGPTAVQAQQQVDRVYQASSGLTYGTTATLSGTDFAVTTATTVQNWYSAWIEFWIAETALANKQFPISTFGPNSFSLDDDHEFTSGSIQYLSRDGFRYVNSSSAVTASYCAILSNGVTAGLTAEYQQVSAAAPTDAQNTGNVDQVIQFFGDATHGNFDYSGYLKFKVQANGYREARSDVVDIYGTIEEQLYVINLTTNAIDGLTLGDPAATGITVTKETTPQSYDTGNGAKDYSITILDSGANSAETILRELNYNLSLDATYQGLDPFDWPEMVIDTGGNYETLRGIVESDGTPPLHGVFVTRDGTNPHPNFTRFQADDGTYGIIPVVANVSITDMLTTGIARLQIIQDTARNASAWQATTAYSSGDKVLRTTGVGTENTAGLYFVATTAGTTGGTEPTWDTVVGNTTADGTVTWTCYAVLFYDDDPASASYATTYTEGEEWSAGDTFIVRFSILNGATSFHTFDTSGQTQSTGFSVIVVESADSVYAANAIDGSSTAVTDKFTVNYTTDLIVLDTNQDFTALETYAFYCYELTISAGMYEFWGAVTAIDAGNYRINTSIVSIFFDETAGFVKQTDNARIYRDDGIRPALDPTGGDNGIEINWKLPVYLQETGVSGLTGPESTQLFNTALESTLTQIKGVGWTDETLKDIRENAGSGLDEAALHTGLDNYANKDDYKADVSGLETKAQADARQTTMTETRAIASEINGNNP